MVFRFFQCNNPACRLRYPAVDPAIDGSLCPRCGDSALLVAQQTSLADALAGPIPNLAAPPFVAVLDNLRSAWNVGSIFRAADGAGLTHIHLCGVCPTPDNPKVTKTALGAEHSLPWSWHANILDLLDALHQDQYTIWALENSPSAVDVYELTAPINGKLALIAGNEIAGIDPAALAQCDAVWRLPMAGRKGSLNVAVAFGAAVYLLRSLFLPIPRQPS